MSLKEDEFWQFGTFHQVCGGSARDYREIIANMRAIQRRSHVPLSHWATRGGQSVPKAVNFRALMLKRMRHVGIVDREDAEESDGSDSAYSSPEQDGGVD